jgi:hypothetical protein
MLTAERFDFGSRCALVKIGSHGADPILSVDEGAADDAANEQQVRQRLFVDLAVVAVTLRQSDRFAQVLENNR